MIPPHYNLSYKSRGKKQSAVASAGYRRGENLYCEQDHELKRFSNRQETVVHSQIVLPEGVSFAFKDPQYLWNSVQKNETRPDARFCYEVSAALVFGLTLEENIEIAKDHATALMLEHGVPVDFNIHKPKDGSKNIHVHFMYPTRALTPDGWAPKQVQAFRGTGGAQLKLQRKMYQEQMNAVLKMADFRDENGELVQADFRSYAEQGVDKIPGIHIGVQAKAIEKKGIRPTSKVRIGKDGRIINYPEIDDGQTRSEYNAHIIALNERRDFVAKTTTIEDQILQIEQKIEIHLDSLDDLNKELAIGFLPAHLQAKFRAALRRLKQLQFMKIFEMFIREKKKKEQRALRIQERVKQAKKLLAEFEKQRLHLSHVKKLYIQISGFCYASSCFGAHFGRSALPRYKPKIPLLITRQDHLKVFKVKAEEIRSVVPPEHRPKIKIKADNSKPIPNGGQADPPAIIKNRFNESSRAEKYNAMGEAYKWLEARNPERPGREDKTTEHAFKQNAFDMFSEKRSLAEQEVNPFDSYDFPSPFRL